MTTEKKSIEAMRTTTSKTKASITSRPVFLFALALVLGVMFASAFYFLPAIALLVLFPMFWLFWQNRRQCFVFVYSFYLFMNWEEIPDALRFFATEHISPSLAVLLWLAHSIFMAAPWVMAYRQKPTLRQAVVRTLIITLILFVPPLGYFIWLQPISAAGVLFPGWGWWGFALTVLLMLLFVAWRFTQGRNKSLLLLLIALFLSAALLANLSYKKPEAPQDWVAVNTHFGAAPSNYFSLAYRQFALMSLAEQGLSKGYKVLIFPENVAVDWLPGTATQWQAINPALQAKQANLVLGAQLDHPDKSFDNVLLTLGVDSEQILPARQPMPLGLWKPWSKQNYHAHWFASGKFKLQGVAVAYLICYEDMISWPLLSSFITGPRPEVVISSANQWFSRYSGYVKQHNVMLANARLFGISTLTAVNY